MPTIIKTTNPFYHETIKKLIVTFGSIFENIEFYDANDKRLKVPLHYASKDKFLEAMQFDHEDKKYDITFPRLGFEMVSLNFSPERNLNPLSKIDNLALDEFSESFTYNRIPYEFQFELYVGAKKYDHSLRIVEQIVPFFTPELTVSIKDLVEFDLTTHIPIILNSVAMQIDNEGSFNQRREIMWTLSFTVKAFLYQDIRQLGRIKETISDLRVNETEERFIRMISEVVPREARKDQPHIIVDTNFDNTID